MKFIFNKADFSRSMVSFLIENSLLMISLYLAVRTRFYFSHTAVIEFFHGEMAVQMMLVYLLVYKLCLYYSNCSLILSSVRPREFLLKILESAMLASLSLFLIYYIYPDIAIGRGIFIISLFISTPLLYCSGCAINRIISSDIFNERVIIIGSGSLAKEIGDAITKRENSGFFLYGYVDEVPRKVGERIIYPNSDVLRLVSKNKISRIIVAMENRRGNYPTNALLKCKLMGVIVEDAITFLENFNSKIIVNGLKPSWFIYSEGFNVDRNKKITKRVMDILVSSIALVLLSPLCLLVAALVRMDSKGDAVFRQRRVGEGGKLFTMMKFRSMRLDAEKNGPVWAKENDSRVTRVGRFLRDTRIDEIPQLINVLKGDMSLVGPRPERPLFVAQLRKQIPYYMLRLTVKPGVTGWAQVKYEYTATVEDTMEKLQYDLYYIKHLGVTLDLMIAWLTIKVILGRKGT